VELRVRDRVPRRLAGEGATTAISGAAEDSVPSGPAFELTLKIHLVSDCDDDFSITNLSFLKNPEPIFETGLTVPMRDKGRACGANDILVFVMGSWLTNCVPELADARTENAILTF